MSERRDPWDVPAVVAGMKRMLARRQQLLDEGARPVGWKLAFGTEAAMEALGLSGPLVGFLTDRTRLRSGGEQAIGGWTAPKLEPEIAIRLGPGGGVEAVAAAIEIADIDRPPTETEEVLAGDVYHRGFVIGEPWVDQPAGPIAAAVARDGEPFAATDDAEATVGRLAELAAYARRYLERFGAEAREGELVISGSVVPMIDVAPGERWASRVAGIGAVEVRLADSASL